MDSATVEIVVETIENVEKRLGCAVGLLIFDTYQKAISAGSGDEDKARDQGAMLANIQRIKETRAIHVALVGHTGKDPTRGARGSNAILGDADVMVTITGAEIRTATVIKANDMPEGPIASFSANSANLGLDDDGDPVTVAIIVPTKIARAHEFAARKRLKPHVELAKTCLEKLLCEEGEQPPSHLHFPAGMHVVKREAWRDRTYREGFKRESSGGARRTAWMRTVDELKLSRAIGEFDEWIWLARPDELGAQP
jgi:hypothetical protein